MAPRVDLRKVAGTRVHAKATLVIALAECKRRFGTLAKNRMVSEIVVSARSDNSGQRANWFITADFEFAGVSCKRKELNIRSVYTGDAPCSIEPAVHIATESAAPTTTDIDEQEGVHRQEGDRAYSTPRANIEGVSSRPSGSVVANDTLWEPGNDQLPIGGMFALVIELRKSNKPLTSKGEVLKFFGILILSTRFEFGARAGLWSNKRPGKYIPAPQFGMTGMSRGRFDTIWQHIRFSHQPEVRPQEMTSEEYRWMLVDGFIERFNSYRVSHFHPSDLICVDESMSRWYGQGGYWINHGLPQYIAIDRKPENGCEIQNAACGRSGIMMHLKLVKTAESEEESTVEDEHNLLHGTMVLKQLVIPWARTGRVVCADSYFASVGSAKELKKLGLRFIGVVKTATKQFPLKTLSEIELTERGQHKSLLHLDSDGFPDMLAFVWMDRDRRYFISSCSSLAPRTPYARKRWRQLKDVATNEDPERVTLVVPQPKATEIYYECCGQIDRHNRCRQDDLMLERKLGTMDWSMRVNMSVLGMCVVDAWLLYKGCAGERCKYSQAEFYTALAEELIDNSFDGSVMRTRMSQVPESEATEDGIPRSGLGPHLTPTKRRRRNSQGAAQGSRLQGRCKVCKGSKTTLVCSQCRADDPDATDVWVCSTKAGANCFPTHMASVHRM